MIFSFLTACAMRSPSLGGGRPGEGAPQGVSSSLRNQRAGWISGNGGAARPDEGTTYSSAKGLDSDSFDESIVSGSDSSGQPERPVARLRQIDCLLEPRLEPSPAQTPQAQNSDTISSAWKPNCRSTGLSVDGVCTMDSSYHTPPAHPSSPSPTTHLPLTPPPSSPEASEASSSGAPVTKRVPRVYPFASDPSSSKPQQQFSRSARKRDSVLALSSIDHLSHHFTKLSAVGEQDSGSDAEVKGARRGPLKLSINGRDGGGSSGKARVDLPPTPARPTQSSLRSPFPLPSGVKLEPDWTTTIGDLKSVERVLGLGAGVKTAAEPIDVLDVIKTTTASLRSVRDLRSSLQSVFLDCPHCC